MAFACGARTGDLMICTSMAANTASKAAVNFAVAVADQERLEELRPGRPGPPRCGIDARRVEDLPHGGGADLVAESDEFAVQAPIPPGGIFGGQAHGQGGNAGGDGWSGCPDGWSGPAALDEVMVPAQDRGRGDQESVAAASG
jgi:hypothetical protein